MLINLCPFCCTNLKINSFSYPNIFLFKRERHVFVSDRKTFFFLRQKDTFLFKTERHIDGQKDILTKTGFYY